MSKTNFNSVQFDGDSTVVNSVTITVLQYDNLGNILEAQGTTVPTNGSSGYSKGATFLLTNAASGVVGVYNNVGTSTSSLFGTNGNMPFMATSATIATTGNTDTYITASQAGVLTSVEFAGVDALATSDTNYITWTITNLGQAGAGTTVMLATSPAGINTTKATGGTAIAANTRYLFTLSGTAANLVVASGDRLLIRAAATGTLANTVTFPTYLARFRLT